MVRRLDALRGFNALSWLSLNSIDLSELPLASFDQLTRLGYLDILFCQLPTPEESRLLRPLAACLTKMRAAGRRCC